MNSAKELRELYDQIIALEQVVTELRDSLERKGQQVAALKQEHKAEIERLRDAYTEQACRDFRDIHAEYGKKIARLEREKATAVIPFWRNHGNPIADAEDRLRSKGVIR
jgi:predicted nucleic acid-binding protein